MKRSQTRSILLGAGSELMPSATIGKEETPLWFDHRGTGSDLVANGRFNRHLGWLLLVADFTCAIWLDPWSFSEQNPAVLSGHRTAAMQAQIMVAAMGFLQLATARFLSNEALTTWRRRILACLTGLGSVISSLGYALSVQWVSAAGLICAGALMNLAGFMAISRNAPGWHAKPEARVAISIICFGMLLVAVMGLLQWKPELFPPLYLGLDDGFRLRMLRLARVAAMALPVLTLLYQEVAGQADPRDRAVRWGRIGMLCGTIGMSTVLTGAGFLHAALEMLLPLPASAIFAGTLCATSLARKHARPLEVWGWLLIALSMAAGLIMGLYAFSIPSMPLHVLGSYNGYARRLIRLAHVYGIVLGLSSIFISRERNKGTLARWSLRIGTELLVAGSSATLIAIFLVAAINLPTAVLSLGPATVTVAMLLCAGPTVTRAGSGSPLSRR